MKEMIKKITGLMLILLLVTSMAACSGGEESEPEQTTEVQTEAEQESEAQGSEASESAGSETGEQGTESTEPEEPEEYDIASNLQIADGVDGEGGSTHVVDTDHFTLSLPRAGTWDYEIDSKTCITFYNIAGREAGCGGRLFSLIAYESGDKSYEELPSYSVAGERDGMVYVAEYPSDVQGDVENEKNMEDYGAVFEEVNKIREGGEDSPLILK